ncbi:MAG: hypothetical protein IJF39_03790 [Clostridia bacterium]|nr:hypothetical protein [Clostridia bacterium]
MKKIAVIDVGSNSVRLMFVADGKILYKTLEITRLGEGLAASGELQPAAIDRSAAAVANFYAQAKADGAERICAFATAAVRSAKNGQAFLSAVRSLCGLEVEVISGEEEAEIGVLGALRGADGGIIDIGGASTEIIVQKSGEILYKKSVDVGVVRLHDLCGREIERLTEYCGSAANAFSEVPQATLHAIGGTATSLASIALRLKEYDPAKITGYALTWDSLLEATEYLASAPPERVAAETCVPQKRAEVLLGGAVWLKRLLEGLRLKEVIVSDADNLEGFAIKKGLL